jgi:hypothetical protein
MKQAILTILLAVLCGTLSVALGLGTIWLISTLASTLQSVVITILFGFIVAHFIIDPLVFDPLNRKINQ